MKQKAQPEGAKALLLTVSVLAGIFLLSASVAWLVSQILPSSFPPYSLLMVWVLVLIPLMVISVRRYSWLASWYYLLPSIIFLLAFTVFPIVMTVNYAFTNYTAGNSGQPDAAARTTIANISEDGKQLTVQLPEGETLATLFKCESSCAGKEAAVYYQEQSNPTYARVASAEGNTIVLQHSVPTAGATDVTRVNTISYVGLQNFREIFSKASIQLIPVFIWTVVFATSTIIINTLGGLFLGILLANKRLKFRNFYRAILFLPWAVPVVISVQIWVALLNQNFGIINRILALFGAMPFPWLVDPEWAKISILLVNLWLGFPFMMTATISALASISEDLYEAASIDGASRWQQIRYITLPLLRDAFTPIVLSGFAFNFNNFGIIYLLTAGGPPMEGRTSTAQSTDILISWGYNTAFVSAGGSNYAAASAIAVLIGVLTIAISMVNFRAAGVFKEASKQ